MNPGDEFNENNLTFQSEEIKYEDVYKLNNLQVVSNEHLVQIIADLLTEIVSETDNIKDTLVTKFTAKTKPSITIKDYLMRISRCANCSQECFILALIYIDRISENNKNFVINSLNIHRILMSSVMIAAKFFDDKYYTNEYYSKVGGIPKVEMNALEGDFLQYLNYKLYVSPEVFFQYRLKLLFSGNE